MNYSIWALKPYYLGPIYPYIIIHPYISPYKSYSGTLSFGSLDPYRMVGESCSRHGALELGPRVILIPKRYTLTLNPKP